MLVAMRFKTLLVVLALITSIILPLPLSFATSADLDSPSSHFFEVLSSGVRIAMSLTWGPFSPTSQVVGVQAASSTTNVQVTLDPNHLPKNEPSVSLNPKNPLNLVAGANDYRLVAFGHQAWAGAYTSSDGGSTWSNQLLPGFPGDTTTTALSAFAVASDPALVFDKNGNLYYTGIVFNVQGGKAVAGTVFTAKSTDGGVSFSQIVLVSTGSRTVFNDKPYMATDNTNGTFTGRVYATWTKFTTTADIMISHSSNGGLTFSSPVKVSTSTTNQGSVPVVGPSGELYVVWNDLSNSRIEAAKSTDGGVSFSSPVTVSTYIPLPSPLPNSKFRVNSFPAAAVDDTNGNVYVAWADYRNGNADVLFSRSTTHGSSWNTPVKINDDTTTNDQFFPWMTVSSGRLSVDFYDRRPDPANHLVDVFYAQSTDGGSSFSPNIRVTDVSSNPDAVLFSGGQSFIGDYIGIASNATTAHPVWTDLRNESPSTPSEQDIFTDSLTPTHDVALASLTPARAVVYQGVSVKPLNVTASVQNLGIFTESSLTVSLFANGTQVASSGIASVPGGSFSTVIFQWDTNPLSKGNYVLSGQVSPVSGETNLSNNKLIGGSITDRFPGDVNGDKKVDILDLSAVAFSFDSNPASPNWNPLADIDNSGSVTILDISIAAANFGKVDP